MWTPRRILFYLSGIVGFLTVYAGYTAVLGGMNGLPLLPDKFLSVADLGYIPPQPPVSPTDTRLIEAFGQKCPELNYSAYPTKIQLIEDGIVFAAGRPQWGETGSRFVTLSPFSIAFFSKPRPSQERVPGEVTEISTLHSDEAVLEFDRPVGSEKDMLSGKAKLVGVELRSHPTPYSTDPRIGRIHITNNQRSPDPNKALIFKTVGPLFYRVADPANPNPAAPDIWTSAAVQIENRENMPRPLRKPGLPTVPVQDPDPIVETVIVTDMVMGDRTPPPTVTAEGMKIYLRPSPPQPPGQPQVKRRGPAFSGIRQLELLENVLVSLWSDGKSGFPGTDGPDTKTADKVPPPSDPPLGASAIGGGLIDAGIVADRIATSALIQIRTLGSFRYDYGTNTARFEIAAKPNPTLQNNVEVTRLSASGNRDLLVSQLLELEFDRPLTQGGAHPPPAEKGKPKGGGLSFKAVRATGTSVYISAQAEQLAASGTSLIHRTGLPDPKDPKQTYTQTVMQGAPLVAVRERSHLEAGRENLTGVLTIISTEPPPGSKVQKQNRSTVRGPGRIEVREATTDAVTIRASWADSLEHSKERVGGKDLDLMVFLGNGRFADPKGEFDLNADTLKLWLEGGSKPAGEPEKGNQPLPFRLQGIGNVHGKSTDAIIKDTDHLNVWFNDVPPPAAVAKPQVAAASPLSAPPTRPAAPRNEPGPTPAKPNPEELARPSTVVAAAPPLLPDPPQPVAEQPKQKPMNLSANTVEVWVVRYPVPKSEASKTAQKPTPRGPQGGGDVKYELDRARCDGRVVVHQDPADPAKSPRGTDIVGATLHLNHFPTGDLLTVVGSDQQQLPAEVHFEKVSLAGPHVVIDQPNNLVKVTGQGWLRMPSGSDLGGAELKKSSDVTVTWKDRMNFNGERRGAEFWGNVWAEQRSENPADPEAKPGSPEADPTLTLARTSCHRMELTFDKPVYFNQLKSDRGKPAPGGKKPNEDPKIETVVCLPASEDGEGGRTGTAGPVLFAEETFSKRTGKHTKAFALTARLLEMKAEESKTIVTASGPGETRVLQLGSKDPANRPPAKAAAGQESPQTRTAMKPADDEMKLTVIRFAAKVRIKDQKGIFQEAVYEEAVRVFHIPSENLSARIEEHALPPRSLVLKCSDVLTVSTYKGKDGADETRQMLAVGAAKVLDDAYIGDGHTIMYDGAMVVLKGYGEDQATLRRRARLVETQDYHSGQEIQYDTRTGRVKANGSSGSRITTGK